MLENTEGTIKNGKSRETGKIGYTRRRKIKQKHNTIWVRHHYMQIKTYTGISHLVQVNTNNVNKTWNLPQTTGGKDKPNKHK